MGHVYRDVFGFGCYGGAIYPKRGVSTFLRYLASTSAPCLAQLGNWLRIFVLVAEGVADRCSYQIFNKCLEMQCFEANTGNSRL